MVTAADALAVLYPAAVPLRDYTVTDDGAGPRITAWHLPDLQPTAEQLAAVTQEQVAAARLGKLRAAAKAGMASLDAADLRTRNALRVVYASLVEERAKVNELIDKLKLLVVGLTIGKLPVRTWSEVMAAVAAQIDAEADPTK